jgi:hypothetical protein
MRTALLLLLALAASGLSPPVSCAEVWKWVDAKGVTHYSDQPVPGATKIEVRAGNISEARPAQPVVSNDDDSSQPPAAEQNSYQTLQIVRPTSDQSIINSGGQVTVEISVLPQLKVTHRLNLLLDGRVVTGFARNATYYPLTGVPRGAHTLTAVVVDLSGNTIQESAPVTFNVRQESIAQPPVGPSLGQPPKPQPRPRPQNTAKNKVLTKQPSYGALNGARPAMNPATNMPVVEKPKPKPGKP